MTAPSRYRNVMIDVETMGHGPSAAVLSIGVVPFQIHPDDCSVAPAAYWVEVRCSLGAASRAGLEVNADTVEWWLAQSQDAREALIREPRHDDYRAFLAAFAASLRTINGRDAELTVWAKPPQYDLVTLRAQLAKFGVDEPWQHRNEQDLRTVIAAAKAAMQSGQDGWAEVLETSPLVKHSALDDAAVQADQVVRFYRRLYRRAPAR